MSLTFLSTLLFSLSYNLLWNILFQSFVKPFITKALDISHLTQGTLEGREIHGIKTKFKWICTALRLARSRLPEVFFWICKYAGEHKRRVWYEYKLLCSCFLVKCKYYTYGDVLKEVFFLSLFSLYMFIKHEKYIKLLKK